MALARAAGGSGYSGTLSTNPAIRQQQLICDPDEPGAGSTSVDYDARLVSLIGFVPGPGYEFKWAGSVEVADPLGRTSLQDLTEFLQRPAGRETGYVQFRFVLSGQPGQITPFGEPGWRVSDDRGPSGVDTHALQFRLLSEFREDVDYAYRIYAAEADTRSGNPADSLTLNDGSGRRLLPKDLAPVRLGTLPHPDPIVVTGTSGNDRLVVTATGADGGIYSLNEGPGYRFSASSFKFVGGAGNDLLEIHNPAGGLFAPVAGIDYDGGGQGADAVAILGGAANDGTYEVGPAPGDGVITHRGPSATQVLRFTGLAPATDTVAEANFTVVGTDAGNAVTIDNGTAVGDGLLRVSIDAFEPIQFANKTNVSVMTGRTAADAGDTVTLNYSESSTGLAQVSVSTLAGADTVTVASTAVRTSIDSGEGDDRVAFGNGTTLNGGTVNGSAGTDLLDYSAFTTAVQVNLGQNAQFRADLEGEQENPANVSTATGTGTLSYNAVTRTFDLTMTVVAIAAAEPNLRFHIHQQAVGVNGGIIVDLFNRSGGVDSPGNLGAITPTADGFVYQVNGVPLPVVNEASLFAGNTYLNIHTTAFPGGEIRGQLAQQTPSAAASGTATATGGVSNLENVTGGSGNDGLVGNPSSNFLRGGGGNDILVGGQAGDILLGGDGSDILAWSNGDGSDVMDGEGGADTVLVNGTTTAGDVFTVGANETRIELDRISPAPFFLDIGTTETLTQVGHGGADTMTVLSLAGVTDLATINLFGVLGDDTFAIANAATATNVRAGSGSDTITLGSGASLGTGTVNGSLGTDLLDYSAFTTAVQVNLGQNGQFRADLEGGQENPANGSSAAGSGTFTYNAVTRTLDIALTVAGIAATEPNLRFHIHQQAVGVNGGIIVDLFNRSSGVDSPGNIGAITPTADGFTYAVAGVPLPAVNEGSFFAGNTYFNIHTTAFPGGEIRGQIAQQTPSAAASGTATGTGGVLNVEDVTGGSGNDGLVGNPSANTLRGGPGNDVIIGGQGGDNLLGGDNNDLLAWSNGDGSDLMNGEGGADTVLVNGTTTAGDQFETSANGTRVFFRRITPGPFTLDIGTTEILTQVGHGGGDTMTVLSLAGVADLATINLFGVLGDDTFDVTPAQAASINVVGGVPTPPASPGDQLNVNTAGTTNPRVNRIILVTGFSGSYQFDDRLPVSFAQVEAHAPSATDLTITKTDGRAASPSGVSTTYTIVATNNGPLGVEAGLSDNFPGVLTNVAWTRTFAGGASAAGSNSGGGNINNHLIVLPIGGRVTYVVTANIPASASGTITNTATITSLGGPDTNPADNAATDVTTINDAPVTRDDTFSTVEDTPLTVAAPGVLTNDTDANGDALTAVALDTSASIGTFVLRPDGGITYTPPPNFHGTDSARYRASDGVAPGNFAFILVNVIQVDDRPEANDDTYATDEDTPLTVTAPGVLVNDVDPDGGLMQVLSFTQPAHGSVSLLPGGSFVYTPAANYRGADSFTYVARDPSGATDGATVSITVRSVEDPPAAVNDSYTVAAGGTLNVPAATGVLANDSDGDGDPLTAALVSGPAHGALTFNPNGSFTYTPAAGFSGADSFTYRNSDGDQASPLATVSINVTPVPSLTINNISITEGNAGFTNAVFTVTISASPSAIVTANFATAPAGIDPATAGADYTTTTGTVQFTPGGPLTQTIAVPVVGDTTPEPPETFFVNLSGASNATIADGQGVGTIEDDDGLPPKVTAVYVSGTAWTAAFRNYLQATGQGDATFGFLLPAGPAQLDELPWAGVDRLSVRFDKQVLVLDADLVVRGERVGAYGISDFDYDEVTHTATWLLASPVRNDKLLLDLDGGPDGVVDENRVALDGDWAGITDAFPSGDGRRRRGLPLPHQPAERRRHPRRPHECPRLVRPPPPPEAHHGQPGLGRDRLHDLPRRERRRPDRHPRPAGRAAQPAPDPARRRADGGCRRRSAPRGHRSGTAHVVRRGSGAGLSPARREHARRESGTPRTPRRQGAKAPRRQGNTE